MWYLTRLALKNRAVTIFLAALLAAASVWTTFQLQIQLLPDIEIPFRIVVTAYPGASPDEVESEVTRPIEGVIEERLKGKGLKHTFSTSADGISVVFAEFEYGTNMEKIGGTIKKGVDELDFPQDVDRVPEMNPDVGENPRIAEVDPTMMPLVILSLRNSNGDLPPHQLKDIANTQILPELRKIDGVFGDMETEGGDREQVLITADPEKMNEFGISMYQIAALLSMGSPYDSVSNVENVLMGIDDITLGDVARVALGPASRTMITRIDGVTSVGIGVHKEAEANTVEVANAVVDKAKDLNEEFGDELELSPVFDQSEFVEENIAQLRNMAFIGAALAIIVVFLFLMAFRASLVTAMSIPFSILIGFLAMYLSGITINLLSLSAMAIAVGRLIDNSIVVVEVIYRRMQQGEGFREAAISGSKSVAGPITSSTLATVAIFLPLVFVGGIVGEIFIPFALTITFALIASLLVALIAVPAFSNWFVGKKGTNRTSGTGIEDAWYLKLYTPPLKWAMAHRAIALVFTGVLFFGSLALVPIIGTSFLPSMGEKMIIVEIELPPGTDIGVTSKIAGEMEAVLVGNDEIESFHTTIGTSTGSLQAAMSAAMGGGDNTAQINIFLNRDADEEKQYADLQLAAREISESVKEAIGTGESLEGDLITVLGSEEAASSQHGFSTGLEISITGESYDDLEQAADLLYERLERIEGISKLETDLTRVVPQLDIELDPSKITAQGLAEKQLQDELLLLKMGGSLPNVSVNLDGESYGIFVRGMAISLYEAENPEALASALKVGWPRPSALSDVADVALVQSPTHIGHIDRALSASITGDITEKNVGAVNQAVEDEIDAVEGEIAALGIEGLEITMGGVAEDMAESFSKMGGAIFFAIGIAFLILVVTMRSFLNPLIIMFSLPLASIGALLGLLITGHTLGMSGMMGVLMLVGIVLSNAIVLIALVEELRKEGVGTYDALIEGGRTRLRPILMTALTTMIAMLPLAFGLSEGGLIAAELAIVVIGGLFSSTLLTLLVIPVIYSLVDALRHRKAVTR